MRKSDTLVKNQAILREYEIASRRKREAKFPKGEGNTVVGTIFDCNRKGFEKALRAYSDRLYLGWNPFKKDGRGCWEVWHRPSRKTATLAYHDEVTGFKLYTADYKPNDYEHWVADLDYLSYDFIQKLREMDSWENKHMIAKHDEEIDSFKQKLDREEEENIKYVVKHNRQAFRDLLDYTQQGFNPLDFFNKK